MHTQKVIFMSVFLKQLSVTLNRETGSQYEKKCLKSSSLLTNTTGPLKT